MDAPNVLFFMLLVAVIAIILIVNNKRKSQKKIQEVLASPVKKPAPSISIPNEDLFPGEVSMIDEQDTPIFDALTSCHDSGWKLEELPADEIALCNTPAHNAEDKKFIDAMIRTLKERDVKPVKVDDIILNQDEVCYSEGIAKIYDAFDGSPATFAKYGENRKRFWTEGQNYKCFNSDQLKHAGDGKFYVTTKNLIIKIGEAVLRYPLGDIAAYSIHGINGLLFNKKNGNSFVVDFVFNGHFATYMNRSIVHFNDDMYHTLFALDKVF